RNLDCNVFHSYGMTETASHIALRALKGPLSDWYEVFPAIGIKQSTDGCLEIMGGVTNNQWLKTNDVVHIEKNKFKWLGRKDFIINSGGIKINPEMIEALLYDYLGSQIALDFIVGGIKDEQFGEKVTLIATKESSNVFDLRNINQYLIDSGLNKYQLPKAVLFLDYFDFTESGKLDRKKILSRVNES
ncbi:MAG TPA: acyl-CoA synthetase, partial [Cyclobacteriaceae bacterium]